MSYVLTFLCSNTLANKSRTFPARSANYRSNNPSNFSDPTHKRNRNECRCVYAFAGFTEFFNALISTTRPACQDYLSACPTRVFFARAGKRTIASSVRCVYTHSLHSGGPECAGGLYNALVTYLHIAFLKPFECPKYTFVPESLGTTYTSTTCCRGSVRTNSNFVSPSLQKESRKSSTGTAFTPRYSERIAMRQYTNGSGILSIQAFQMASAGSAIA